jgi:hypothetical protein
MRRILFLLTLIVPGLLFATTVVPMGVEKLTKVSTHIVEGQAVSSAARWNSEHTFIFTYTKFEVRQALKGQTPGTIVVRQIGGTVDGITQRVAGVRHWRTGEEAVLFLQSSSTPDGSLVVTGLMQGNFMVQRTSAGPTYVSNGVPEAFEYQAGAAGVANYRGNRLRLEDLESRVKKAVER